MELFILLIVLAIFAETTFLSIKRFKPGQGNKRKIYVDTSVLIDGRILNVARSGFIDGDLIVLKSVLLELQLLADGKDSDKRTRARAGLTNVSELERVINVNTEILDDGSGHKKVDEELCIFPAGEGAGYAGGITSAAADGIKVAEAEKIETLNINDLALAVRNEFLPGEKIKLKIMDKGSGRGQGVGHLSDGTMVVVDNAANKIGKELTVEFVKFHETSAGKMIFARIVNTRRK